MKGSRGMGKLTKAQRTRLELVPDSWAKTPNGGDSRPNAPLLRMGLIEFKSTDVTPEDWGNSSVRVVREEWRITDAGRAALKTGEK